MCMSVQKQQPLIWLARSRHSSCVEVGRIESGSCPADESCLRFRAIAGW